MTYLTYKHKSYQGLDISGDAYLRSEGGGLDDSHDGDGRGGSCQKAAERAFVQARGRFSQGTDDGEITNSSRAGQCQLATAGELFN